MDDLVMLKVSLMCELVVLMFYLLVLLELMVIVCMLVCVVVVIWLCMSVSNGEMINVGLVFVVWCSVVVMKYIVDLFYFVCCMISIW